MSVALGQPSPELHYQLSELPSVNSPVVLDMAPM